MKFNFKSKFKKFLSSVTASMMIFGATPKSRTKAISNDAIAIGLTVGFVALTATAIGAAAYFEHKAWQEEMKEREYLINNEANEYIASLARNLKTVIPRNYSNLFRNLVKCQNRDMLLEWQGNIASSSLGLGSLRKIKDCLYSHWLTYESKDAYNNIYVLEVRCKELAEEEKFNRKMQIEREKIRIEEAKVSAKKNQVKVVHENNTNIINTNISNNNTNINNNSYTKSYNHNNNKNYNNNYNNYNNYNYDF